MGGGIRFLLDGEMRELDGCDPTLTVLELLRTRLGRTGAKEGCAEGDCGACTVLLGEREGEGVAWRAVNACILFVPQIDGRALLTVESVGRPGAPHPVQQAMVDLHGSQCGFCTPGFVMSLYGRSIAAAGTRDVPVRDVIAGNLCRCTGYGPILAAGEAVAVKERDDVATAAALGAIARTEPLALEWHDPLAGMARRWFAPRTVEQLARLLLDQPDAHIVAGATDVGLWVTKRHRVLPTIISIGDVAGFRDVREDADAVTIAAGARYADAHAALAGLHPDLGELVRRIGAVQVRNSGTIGGNIANGSPIGDMPPALIALGATLVLRRGDERRELPLEDYFLAYGEQDRRPGEFVEAVRVPRPARGMLIAVTKLSKRFDSDISAVCGAFALQVEGGVVRSARIAFGGMAPTPGRASGCEAALVGRPWSEATVESAIAALSKDYSPISDMRGSAAYRRLAAGNLLRRLWLQSRMPGEEMKVLAHG